MAFGIFLLVIGSGIRGVSYLYNYWLIIDSIMVIL
jgi:hypothetical protein